MPPSPFSSASGFLRFGITLEESKAAPPYLIQALLERTVPSVLCVCFQVAYGKSELHASRLMSLEQARSHPKTSTLSPPKVKKDSTLGFKSPQWQGVSPVGADK